MSNILDTNKLDKLMFYYARKAVRRLHLPLAEIDELVQVAWLAYLENKHLDKHKLMNLLENATKRAGLRWLCGRVPHGSTLSPLVHNYDLDKIGTTNDLTNIVLLKEVIEVCKPHKRHTKVLGQIMKWADDRNASEGLHINRSTLDNGKLALRHFLTDNGMSLC